MPNIILTEYCNLNCPYCFANKMIQNASNKEEKIITIQQFDNILRWLIPNAIKDQDFSIGLIGGEPTLHPKFKEILIHINEFNKQTNSRSVIFTNGILLKDFLPYIGISTSILININNLEKEINNKLLETLEDINSLNWFENNKVTLGCNLYLQEKNYNFFWNIVDKFLNKIKNVRVSVTAPNEEKLKNDKELYYNSMKEVFLNFVNEAKKRNLKITYDCNQIPLCFFNDEEKKIINSLGSRRDFCNPVIDITPNFQATNCFGVYSPVDCSQFSNLDELSRFFQNQIFLKINANNNSLCKNCEKIKLMQCQGGCLSFSSLKN